MAKDPKTGVRIDQLVKALATEDELGRLAAVGVLIALPDIAEAATTVLVDHGERGVASAALRAVIGAATEADVALIGELAATAATSRTALALALSPVADRVPAPQLARAIVNLATMVPLSRVVIKHRATVRAVDATLADRLDAYARFLETHASTVASCTGDAKERVRDAASAKLMALTGPDRVIAALWIMTEGAASNAAIAWARPIVLTEASIHPLRAAVVLGGSLDEKQLPELLAPVAFDRIVAIALEVIERGWGDAAKNLAYGRPQVFHDARVFAALEKAIEAPDPSFIYQLFQQAMRHWCAPLDDAQAAAIARAMVAMLGSTDKQIVRSVANGCHYFMHAGGIPVFRAALEGTLVEHVRDELYDAVHSIVDDAASQLLVDRIFVETECTRDLVFSYNKRVPASWQADILARIDKERSFHALWFYVACQVHWAHHPRNVVAAVEKLLAWPASEGDPSRRAMIFSHGVAAALELRRFDLARTCLDRLAGATQAADPAEKKALETVLADTGLTDTLAKLRANELDAADAALRARVDQARAAGQSIALDDAELGVIAACAVGWVIHRDAKTHEVWFFDQEHEFFYFDGSGLATTAFQQRTLHPEHDYDVELDGLAAACSGWTTEQRSLHRSDQDFRYTLRSGATLLLRFSGRQPRTWGYPFVLTFPDATAATRAFDALASNPLPGFRDVDPFYVSGKRGGTYVYEYGNSTEYGYACGKASSWARSTSNETTTMHATREAAIAAFDAAEADALRRGQFPRKIELEDRIRPLDDMPLVKWLEDRARDDDKSATWHLEALTAIHQALAITGIEIDHDIELGPPVSAAQLAAYDATLPTPMPPEMREMWTFASTASWRVGERSMRLLSPDEVVRRRARDREAFIATVKKRRDAWPLASLDIFVLRDDAPYLAFDQRQDESDCWMCVGEHDDMTMALGSILGYRVIRAYVDAVVKQYVQLKKLDYGQSLADLGAKKSKPKKPAKKRS